MFPEVSFLSSLDIQTYTEVVASSWKRCQRYGLKPTDPFDNRLLTGKLFQERLKENETLVRHASKIFDTIKPFIQQSGQTALLIDAQGCILYAAGDPGFSKRAEAVQLQVGAVWDEKRKGTNAIGVAITEKIPVRVHAAEHFCQANAFLTCASSPIFSPTGELIGVINFSGKRETYHHYSLTLAVMVAESLQNRLLLEEAKQDQLVTLQELEFTANHNPLPLLSLDRDNRIIRANQAALRAVGKDAIGKPFNGIEGFSVKTIQDSSRTVWRSVAVRKPQEGRHGLYSFSDIAGTCPNFVEKKELASKAALTEIPVLLLGESGTGKELFAQSIHSASLRADRPFIAVNCGAIPDSLVESEWFGYERGAFTGANREGSTGKFEAAHTGTIFLDEIGDMSLRAQAALLRVLQERTVTPVGSTKSRRIDVRIVAATHKHLPLEIKEGRFRADLYYRLKGIQITLPSLRERSDLLTLVEHWLHKNGCPYRQLPEETKRKLLRYGWPGNIRELHGVLMQASFLAGEGPIRPEHLHFDELDQTDTFECRSDGPSVPTLRDAEIGAIQRALQSTGWNLSKSATLLDIGRTTLYRKIEQYGIEP